MNSNKICNGKGSCSCGKCICAEPDLCSGPHCENCQTSTRNCEEYFECVKCHLMLEKHDCLTYCSTTTVDIVESLADNSNLWAKNMTIMCSVKLDDKCSTNFVYNNQLNKLRAREAKTCVGLEEQNYTIILIGVVAGILAVGVSLLCTWKLFVTLHDQREYARFEEEKKKAVFGATENPIYKKATATYANPTFASGK